jgi:hypothetical protein
MNYNLRFATIAVLFLLLNTDGRSQNAIINPGFENGLNGWSEVNEGSPNATISLDNSIFYSGTQCA